MSSNTLPASMLDRRVQPGGVYETILRAKLGYNSTSLALIDYGVQFSKARGFKDSDKFIGGNGREFVTNFFGEIAPGFVVHPTGSYTSPADGTYVPISDTTRVKLSVPLQAPSNAPTKMKAIFYNQLSTLGDIIMHDNESSKQTRTKSWLGSSSDDGTMDKLFVTMGPLFKVPNENRTGGFKPKVQVTDDNDDLTPIPSGSSNPVVDVHLGDTYPCTAWPGYGGPRFNHTFARAAQMNVRDPQGRLIRPHNMYEWLAPGALVLIQATMHVYRFGRMTIYQLNATSIQVIDKSDISVDVPTILALPSRLDRDVADNGNSATEGTDFVDFTSLLASGSVSSPQSTANNKKHSSDEIELQSQEVVIDEDVEMAMDDVKGKRPAGSAKKVKKGQN
ncbi:hypothetical protein EV360DRAFT_80163 [Lentinula raphanica]|nr:hypothetical protein EV360DRAFT_80163 [Lentinula raphanica]